MRKASKVLLLIAGILAILAAVGLLIAAISELVLGGFCLACYEDPTVFAQLPESTQKAINDLLAQYHTNLKEIAAVCIAFGVWLLVFAILSIPAAVLSFVTRKKEKPALALIIVTLVFNTISGNLVGLVGSIFGIVANAQEK